MPQAAQGLVIIACGALAREIVALKRLNGWSAVTVECLPPELHNRPEQIPGAVQAAIHMARERYERIFVAYADCGTGGRLDAMLASEGVARLPGAHCYEFFATAPIFSELAAAQPGTFYLTDFLVRHFDRLVIEGLGMDRHPELRDEYFRNYQRLLYLMQSRDAALGQAARSAAQRLGLAYEERYTGYGELQSALAQAVSIPVSAIGQRREQPTWRP
jgi:hypothetical protein